MKIRGPQDYLGQTLREQIQRAEDRAAALEEKLKQIESRPKRVIDISPVRSDAVYLIVSAPAGVIYAAQTGGIGCHRRELEGYIIPLSLITKLSDANPVNGEFMDSQELSAADLLLRRNRSVLDVWHSIELEVDMRKKDSEEAWIWVKGKFCKDNDGNDCEEDFRGVLVYENSD